MEDPRTPDDRYGDLLMERSRLEAHIQKARAYLQNRGMVAPKRIKQALRVLDNALAK